MTTPALDLLTQHRLIAIIRLSDLSQAIEIARALLRGGIVIQEFTLTNPDALKAIEAIRKQVPEFRSGHAAIGIGSVRTADQVVAAHQSGSDFIVSPNTDPEVIGAAKKFGLPCMPGAMTPTEIVNAWKLGASVVKVFPARALGPTYIADVLAPLPDIKFMPTGGVDLENMADYFAAGATAVGIGVNALGKAAIENGDWDSVSEVAAQCARAARAE
jgi:2-dehydro-3-deoxyphosphogluconate aldolase/(4S)-4-hydroxy-2-oxoglutarate aldolase